jgi:hypothetical protein
MVFADVFRPAFVKPRAKLLYDVATIVGGSLLTALMARISIPLPFSPGDAVKLALAALLLPAGWRALARLGRGEPR